MNVLRNCLANFWIFWGNFLRIFREEFFQGFFWEEFFWKNFFGGRFWKEFLGENFVRIFLGGILTLLKSDKLFENGRN